MMFQAKTSPQGSYRPYETPTLYPAACTPPIVSTQGKSNISMLPQPSPPKAALMAPSKLRAEMPKKSVSSIIWDSCASLSITNDKTDFHGTLKPCLYKHVKVKGVAQAIKVHGQGTVLWSELDEADMLRTLKVPALYTPDAKVKLLSINSLGDVYPEETVTFHLQEATMTGVPGNPN